MALYLFRSNASHSHEEPKYYWTKLPDYFSYDLFLPGNRCCYTLYEEKDFSFILKDYHLRPHNYPAFITAFCNFDRSF